MTTHDRKVDNFIPLYTEFHWYHKTIVEENSLMQALSDGIISVNYEGMTWKYCITGPLWRESTFQWIPITQDQQCRPLIFLLLA